MDWSEQLGCTGRDAITGFEGVATGYCKYITGTPQVQLTPVSVAGKYAEAHWFDVDRVERMGAERVVVPGGA